jgi:hypothetical protein
MLSTVWIILASGSLRIISRIAGLGDVATVSDSVQDVRNAGMTNAKPAILLMIRKLPEPRRHSGSGRSAADSRRRSSAHRWYAPASGGRCPPVSDSVQDVRNAGMTNAKPAILLMIRKLPEANIIQLHLLQRGADGRRAVLGDLQVDSRRNGLLQLRQAGAVATVSDSVQDVRNAGMTNAKPAILLMIRKLPEAKITSVCSTSSSEARMVGERSWAICRSIAAGMVCCRLSTCRSPRTARRPSAPRWRRWSRRW